MYRLRFNTNSLFITPELVGQVHSFSLNNMLVEIELPDEEALGIEERKPLSRLTLWEGSQAEGRIRQGDISVEDVDIIIHTDKKLDVSEEILSKSPATNTTALFQEHSFSKLNAFTEGYEHIAEQAFNLWLRTLRWKSDYGSIGRPIVSQVRSGLAAELLDKNTRKPFFNAGHTITIRTPIAVNQNVWNEVESALEERIEPPVYIGLLFDGVEHIKLGDLQRAIIDFAVSCESYLRTLILRAAPEDMADSWKKFIDEANIRPVTEKLVKGILTDVEHREFDKVRSKLHKLFDLRNQILHSGRSSSLTHTECIEYAALTRRVIQLRHL